MSEESTAAKYSLEFIALVGTIMTGVMSWIASAIADVKINKAKGDLEKGMHAEHKEQADSIKEIGKELLGKMDDVKEDVTEIGKTVVQSVQRQDDMADDIKTQGDKISTLFKQGNKHNARLAVVESKHGIIQSD